MADEGVVSISPVPPRIIPDLDLKIRATLDQIQFRGVHGELGSEMMDALTIQKTVEREFLLQDAHDTASLG
jgi:hypothetical protein